MRTTADDKDDSSLASCVVDSLIENESSNATVGVNNCVNIISNCDATSSFINDNNDFLLSDDAPIYENLAAELDDDDRVKCPVPCSSSEPIYDVPKALAKLDEDILNKFLFNDDDDALTSSKYLDVTSRCDMLQPSTSSARPVDQVVVLSSHYASTRDNNQKHQKAVRKNFSLWIGVTSCVWGLLLLLMKNYVD
jgi:hypothetical protein